MGCAASSPPQPIRPTSKRQRKPSADGRATLPTTGSKHVRSADEVAGNTFPARAALLGSCKLTQNGATSTRHPPNYRSIVEAL
jgi:hypothetical protein